MEGTMEPLMVFASGLALFAVLKAAERILEWFSARRHRKRGERRLLLIQPDVPEHPKAVAEEGAVADAICELPWPCAEALAVASCESTLRPDAVSWTGESFGLMQIHAETWAVFMDAHGFDFWNQWMIAEKNLQMAYIIWQRSGWGAWSCW